MPCDVVYLLDELQMNEENRECPEVSKNQYTECPRMYQKTMVVRKSARTLRSGGEGGRRKHTGRGEPGCSTGRRGRRHLMRAGGGLGRPTRVATRRRLLGAVGAAGDGSPAESDPTD